MGKKRILVYTESYLPAVGGLENNTVLLCQSLSKLGHQVTLLTPQKGAPKNSEFEVIQGNQYFALVKSNDIVVINGGISFKIIIPCLLLNKPYMPIYQMATLFTNIHSNSLKVKFTNTLRKLLAKNAKLNIGVSRYSYQALINVFGKKKSGLLINPADPTFQRQSTPKEKQKDSFNCLFAGRLINGKGIRLLVESIELLNTKGLPFKLHIIGEGPEQEWLKTKLHTKNIVLYPPAKPQELKAWYAKVDLTVIPSTSHIEGSPLVMAESLAMGTPVLVSSQPAMTASVNHENMYFKSGDLEDLTKKLSALLNPEIYNEVLDHSLTLANDYDYKNYVSRLEKLICLM